ncbi:hypothetical protein K7X08_009139 [Anisodus acutangulus]|uniref:Uncharacterized protein n=1 Tax=Anisodus acutangulus TaxID=402998 RepID=A0A9Q1MZB7_9SOLA|nr:hypothetical protein K7X08_009139 [Anisodus acutangulus]
MNLGRGMKIIIVHDALDYGDCHLSLAMPKYEATESCNRIHVCMGPKFMKENGLKHVTFSAADGALEVAPAEIEGRVIVQSQAGLVAGRKSLMQRKGVLDITHEMLERLEAHLRAVGQFTVTANMRGSR